jgi:type IV pilus assembly protein PilQ
MATGFLSKLGKGFVLCFGLAVLLGPLAVAVPSCGAASAEEAVAQEAPAKEPVTEAIVPPEAAASHTTIQKINSVDIGKGRVSILTDGMVQKLRYFSLESPKRLVVDLYNARPAFVQRQFSLEEGFTNLRIGGDSGKTRFVFDAEENGFPSFQVVKMDSGVSITWGTTEAAPDAQEPPVAVATTEPVTSPKKVESQETAGALISIEAMDFLIRDGQSLFTVTLSRPGELVPLDRMGRIVRFGIKNAHLSQRFRRSFDCSSFPSAVKIITPYTVVRGRSEEIRFAAELKAAVPVNLTMNGNTFVFAVENGDYGAKDSGSDDIEIKSVPLPAASKEQTTSGVRHAIETAEGPSAKENEPVAASVATVLEAGRTQTRYTGTKVSLVFDDADIRKIFQLLGEVSNLNLILGEEVKGNISLRLIDVPWDQAFDLVLEMKELGKLQEGNVIRILPKKMIAQMDEARMTAARTKERLEDLITVAIPVSYAPLENLEKPVKDRLSDRGRCTLDKGNKQLIIIDVPSSVEAIKKLIGMIDTPVRQVMIEARIVEVSTTSELKFGVKWGISNTSDNSSSSIGLGGGFLIPPANITDTSVGGVGSIFSYNGLSSTIIDMRLSAAESAGDARIISKPRVVTLNGQEAVISQGTSIPYQTTTDEEIKTEWIDANLELKVTPVINPDNSVILQIKATNNQPSTTLYVAEMPAVDKKEAKTTVLVKDAETTVIGGIFVEQENFSTTGVPFLMDIPVLGHLFKSTSKTLDRRELLVFITPKILEDRTVEY